MKHATTTSLCWIAFVLALGGCATDPTANTVTGASTTSVKPSYSGTFSRPLSDLPPGDGSESKARVHVELGMEYLNIGRAEVALDEARAALKVRPGYAAAYHLRAMVFAELKQNAPAETAFRDALREAPGDPDSNNSFGWFLCQQGRVREALAHFATATANPYYNYKTRPYTNAGICLENAGDLTGAEGEFNRALQADPANGEALYRLAEVGYRRGNYRGAHDLLVQYHQRFNPSARSAWLGVCAARRLGERHAEASYTEQLRTRFPASPENALLTQGKCK